MIYVYWMNQWINRDAINRVRTNDGVTFIMRNTMMGGIYDKRRYDGAAFIMRGAMMGGHSW